MEIFDAAPQTHEESCWDTIAEMQQAVEAFGVSSVVKATEILADTSSQEVPHDQA